VDLTEHHARCRNVYAVEDHIVPAEPSRALGNKQGRSTDYSELGPLGPCGRFVGGKAGAAWIGYCRDWLAERDREDDRVALKNKIVSADEGTRGRPRRRHVIAFSGFVGTARRTN